MERLDGKRIIVTGGANGMGQITVEGFVELGAKIVFFDILDEKAAEVAEKTGAKYIHATVNPDNSHSGQNFLKRGFAVKKTGTKYDGLTRNLLEFKVKS